MAEEFPEAATWFERHDSFFRDVITATEKRACFFPAAVNPFDVNRTMQRLSPAKQIALHLIRASYLDMGEHREGAWPKQIAVLRFGRHMNQQPLLLDRLVGTGIEASVRAAMLDALLVWDALGGLTEEQYAAAVAPLSTEQDTERAKWTQTHAYERLFIKNTMGIFYETNAENAVRFTRLGTFLAMFGNICPEAFSDRQQSYWGGVRWKFSRAVLWFSGLPSDPKTLSDWIDDAYRPDEVAVSNEFFEAEPPTAPGFELNYRYGIRKVVSVSSLSLSQIPPLFYKQRMQSIGAEIICDLVRFKRQHGQFPETLNELEQGLTASGKFAGFIYEESDNTFRMYHVGQNGIDEQGKYEMPPLDFNDFSYETLSNRKPITDDIMIWPKELTE